MGNILAKWWLKSGLSLYESQKKEEAVYHWKRNVIKMRTSVPKYLTYNYLAIIAFNYGNFRDYLTYATCQLAVAEKLNNIRFLGESFLHMARANSMLGEYLRCIAYCREALRHECLDPELEAQVYLMMGDMYYRLGCFERSINCWQKSLDKAQERDDVVTETEILVSIGKMHLDFGDSKGATHLFEKAYMLTTRNRLCSGCKMKFDHQTTLYFAAMLQRLGYSTYAMHFIDTVIKVASTDGNRWLYALAMIQRASALRGYVPDEDHLRDAMNIAIATGDKVSQFICNRVSSETYEMFGENSRSSWYDGCADKLARSIDVLCSVCNEVFGQTSEEIDILPCAHIFHSRCIAGELERSKRKMQHCPKCGELFAFNQAFLSLKL